MKPQWSPVTFVLSSALLSVILLDPSFTFCYDSHLCGYLWPWPRFLSKRRVCPPHSVQTHPLNCRIKIPWGLFVTNYHYGGKDYYLNTGCFQRVKVMPGRGREMTAAGGVLGTKKYSGVVVPTDGCAENFLQQGPLMGEHSFWNRARHELKRADIRWEMNTPLLTIDLEWMWNKLLGVP